MNKSKYYTKISNKHKLSKTKFKSTNLYINESLLNLKTLIVNYNDFREYFESLISVSNDICYLVKSTFKLHFNKVVNKFDILILNNKMEIIEIIKNYDKTFKNIYFQNPVSLLVLPQNSIKFYSLSLGQRIKMARFSY